MSLSGRDFRNSCFVAIALLMGGCANSPVRVADAPTAVPAASTTSACIDALRGQKPSGSALLGADLIRALNWNIQKGIRPGWTEDLSAMLGETELLILQEASPDFEAWSDLIPRHHRSFAEGYQAFGASTGVMTLSTAAPLTECELAEREPWLGTSKAMLITEYGLVGIDTTLLVINLHGINFSIGMRGLQRQLDSARCVIIEHLGPVIFSGDFNTWRAARTDLVAEAVADLGLEAVQFDADHRTRVLGQPLDHIYVRGLETVHATTIEVDSSDHNPMLVGLRLAADPGIGIAHHMPCASH